MNKIIYTTGGYSGSYLNINSSQNSHFIGTTRAGYQIPKYVTCDITGVIMCNAGEYDSHQNPDFKYIYGNDWGDDTLAFSYLNDIGIFIAPFGAWTEIELMIFKSHKDKKCYIFDSGNDIKSEKYKWSFKRLF